ncbi:MAG: hypothetical protein AB7E47_07280 [Desulfovibrionaceae bacterium]
MHCTRFTTGISLAALLFAAVVCLGLPVRAMADDAAPLIAEQLFDKVDRVAAELDTAAKAYEKIKQVGDAEAIKQAEATMQAAETELDKAEADLNTARVAALAKAAGVPESQVVAMRQSGMGWGVIAKELGVHPGLVAHTKNRAMDTEQEVKVKAAKTAAKKAKEKENKAKNNEKKGKKGKK